MTHPNKIKGNNFEREIVSTAQACGLKADRSWGSDGRSRGLPKEVDVMLEGYRTQCKRLAKFPKWARINRKENDLVIFREDQGEAYVLIPYDRFLVLLYGINQMLKKEDQTWASSQKT